MGIRLRDDVFFSDPAPRIREYCEIEVYEGYDDQHNVNNSIIQNDIDSANNLYANINRYDKSEGCRLLEQSAKISPILAEIPNEPLGLIEDKDWVELQQKIETLLKRLTTIHGIDVPKSAKILHTKRPEFFPALDNYVVQFLTGKPITSSLRDIDLAMKSMSMSRDLIKSQIIGFTDLQMKLGNLPIPLTTVRLFDILCWTTYKWDILGRTDAPKGVASKSLLGYTKASPKPTVKPKSLKTAPVKKTINTHSPLAQSNVIMFFNDLSNKAHYGIRGEKPVAVLAVLKYLMDTRQIGVKFLDLLDYPYYEKVRRIFIDLAGEYGEFTDPVASWGVITGVTLELQNAIVENGMVNQAVADLSQKEITNTYYTLIEAYKKKGDQIPL